MPSFENVVAIVRSFKDERIGKFVNSMLGFIPTIIVVVHAEADKGLTRGILAKECPADGRVQTVEPTVRNGHRSWSELLNAGIESARERGRVKHIFNVSNTTSFGRCDVEEMLAQFDNDLKVGVVGTTFRGVGENDEPVELGKSYNSFPRNTGMIIGMQVLDSHPRLSHFDTFYDGKNGMEDYAFIKTMAHLGWDYRMLDLRVPVRVGVHWDQLQKEKFMDQGMHDVNTRLKTLDL